MSRVISHAEVEAAGPGGTVVVEPDALVTPLAVERARALGVQLTHGASTPPPSLIRQVTRQVVARLGDAPPAVLEAVISEVVGALGSDAASVEEVAPGID